MKENNANNFLNMQLVQHLKESRQASCKYKLASSIKLKDNMRLLFVKHSTQYYVHQSVSL